MMNELVQAKQQKHNVEQLNRHIENVQLLCDIILADEHELERARPSDTTSTPRSDITEQEMKAMVIGQQTKSNKIQTEQLEKMRKGTHIYDDEDGNGDSLFDF